jgi:dCMP deaminase
MTNKWHDRFFQLAAHISTWSKDSTKVGCVIVGTEREILSTGYNGFPRGIQEGQEDDPRTQRPVKYQWTEHAERNAIYNAARNGIRLDGASLYTNWFPCSDCSRAIIQSGIKLVAGIEPTYEHPTYGNDFKVSLQMLTEAGVQIVYL